MLAARRDQAYTPAMGGAGSGPALRSGVAVVMRDRRGRGSPGGTFYVATSPPRTRSPGCSGRARPSRRQAAVWDRPWERRPAAGTGRAARSATSVRAARTIAGPSSTLRTINTSRRTRLPGATASIYRTCAGAGRFAIDSVDVSAAAAPGRRCRPGAADCAVSCERGLPQAALPRLRSATDVESKISSTPSIGLVQSTSGGKIVTSCSLNHRSKGSCEEAKPVLPCTGSSPSM